MGASIRTEIPWTPSRLDDLYRKNYGLTRTEINANFLADIPKEASFLEVGCNTGNQLLMLNRMGWSNLSAVELQPYAAEIASQRLSESLVKLGSALAVPFADSAFDVVFTSGVLIHIAPKIFLARWTKSIAPAGDTFGSSEYYAPEVTEVTYRSHRSLLWKMDFGRRYLERFDDLGTGERAASSIFE